jgi:hypothetical protein
MTSTAYGIGFEHGQRWTDASDAVDGWDEATVNAIGAREFGALVGLSERAVKARGRAWRLACRDYNRGCVDGVKHARGELYTNPCDTRFLVKILRNRAKSRHRDYWNLGLAVYRDGDDAPKTFHDAPRRIRSFVFTRFQVHVGRTDWLYGWRVFSELCFEVLREAAERNRECLGAGVVSCG